MKYIFKYESFENKITKIFLIDLFKEIEYHKVYWGNLQREFNEKQLFHNKFFYIDEKTFNKILSIKPDEFYYVTTEYFFKENQLEEFLI